MRIKTSVLALIIILLVSGIGLPSVLAQGMERPDSNVDIKRFFGNRSTDGNTTAGVGVELDKSVMSESPYTGTCIHMNVSVIGTTRAGIHYTNLPADALTNRPWLDYKSGYASELTALGSPFPVTNDSWGQWLTVGTGPFAFMFRYYGVNYTGNCGEWAEIWVSGKGFAALDLSNQTSTVAHAIPDPAAPNAVIAPLWTNLKHSSNSRIRLFTVSHMVDSFLMIVWENFLDSSQTVQLTFSVAFQLYKTNSFSMYSCGDPIYLIYNSVSTISDSFVYGLENQDGTRGSGGYVSGSQLSAWNGKYLNFYPDTTDWVIKKVYLIFQDPDQSNVRYIIPKGDNDISGINLRTQEGSRPLTPGFWIDLSGLVVDGLLTLGGYDGVNFAENLIDPFGIFDAIQKGQDSLDLYSRYQNNKIFCTVISDSSTSGPVVPNAYMVAITPDDARPDAALHLQLKYWILDTASHSLNIKAVVEYGIPSYEPYTGNDINVTASTVLNIAGDTNGNVQTAQPTNEGSSGQDPLLYLATSGYDAVDYYNASIGYLDALNVTMVPPPGQDFDLFLYAPNGTLVASSCNRGDARESVATTSNRAGSWTIKVTAYSGQGFYNFTVQERGGGDINRDGSIDVYDSIILAGAFNSKPGDSNWNPRADLNRDGVVDIYDTIILAGNYGKHQ
jgi:hypothetical protein